MRQLEIALNKAFKTADAKVICVALDDLVRGWSNVSKLAKDADIDRSVLYRTFRTGKGPRLSMVVRVVSSAGFRLIVNARGNHPRDGRPNHFGQARKTTAHLELRANPGACAEFLTRAFETSDTGAIVKAFDATLRAQKNVVEFAKKASLERSSLYRAFRPNRDPQFSTVVHFLRALGLRFAVAPSSLR
jgi:probable addiction module antidote protein